MHLTQHLHHITRQIHSDAKKWCSFLTPFFGTGDLRRYALTTKSIMKPPGVIISFSHDSTENKGCVLDFATTFCDRGVDAYLISGI